MGHQGQIVGSTKGSSQNNDETSSDQSSDDSSKNSNITMAASKSENIKKVEKEKEGLRQRGNKRGLRYNSFSSSVYDEDARWKALNEDRPDHPVHKASESLFTTSSGFHNFRGLLNWCIVILVFTTGRAALENLIKYGVLISPVHWYYMFMSSPNNFPMVWVLIALLTSLALVFVVEKMAAKFRLHEGVIISLQGLILLCHITFPAVFIYCVEPSPLLSSPMLFLTVNLFLKLVSYIQVNKWCRMHAKKEMKKVNSGKKSHQRSPSIKAAELNYLGKNDQQRFANIAPYQHYPDNLYIKDYVYFLIAPTVCYELNYPRSARIRLRFLVKRALEIFFLLGLILCLIQQWIYPTLENSVVLFEKMNYPMMVARILKLAIPNHFIWLIGFYFIFHSCCNFQAELLRFADRDFYKDWWNSEDLQQFWSTWNIPIHRFARRHVYKRLLAQGSSKLVANLSVFMLSAIFHEYLFSIPLNMLRPWFIMSFVLQTPLVMMSDRMRGKLGNITVWLMLILGQPLAIMMYWHDYYLSHFMHQ